MRPVLHCYPHGSAGCPLADVVPAWYVVAPGYSPVGMSIVLSVYGEGRTSEGAMKTQ
jgi:hypothetical protein